MLEFCLLIFVIVLYFVFSFNSIKHGGASESKIDVLIVDVANMYASWKYDTKRNESYLTCIDQHYKEFIKHNDINICKVIYVIKNCEYKHKTDKGKISVKKIEGNELKAIHKFLNVHKNTMVAIAQDYNRTCESSKKNHYMKERDDYLCFFIARLYKRKYINAVIMSNDKFKDFVQLGYVPPFEAIILGHDEYKESITPCINDLGQLSDFKMVNITLDFSFGGNFKKDPSFKQKPIWI